MIGKAACRGAATIVNAIPTGKGAAFGITLEVDVEVAVLDTQTFTLRGPEEGTELAEGCVRTVFGRVGLDGRGAAVRVESEIPVSRGLKSSSAFSNAVTLATFRAAGIEPGDDEVLGIAIDESLKAGVTITGAYDDAAACYLGGAVVTDNRARRVLSRGAVDATLTAVIHVPERRITKDSVKGVDFGPVRPRIEKALELALAGEYFRAMEINSGACSEVLGLSEEVAEFARENGAVASGISGTGPATVSLVRRGEATGLIQALRRRFDGRIIEASVNDTPAREVVPRLC